MSFCSLSYEFVISTKLSHLLGEGIFIFPVTMGLFILFMGLGSALWSKLSSNFSQDQLFKYFLLLEGLLTIFGALSIIAIEHSVLGMENFHRPLFVGFGLVAIIGFLSGQELPALFQICSQYTHHQKLNRRIIFYDYLASFFASVLFALVLFRTLGLIKTALVIASCNLAVFVLIYFVKSDQTKELFKRSGLALVCLVLFITGMSLKSDKIENFYFFGQYAYGNNHVLLTKHFTSYQQILLFAGHKDPEVETPRDINIILKNPSDYYVYAYLNGSIQFFNTLGDVTDAYHTFLVDPFLSVFEKEYKDILVLGGGDGLPARQLLMHKTVKSINMVDLDGDWVNFTKTNPLMNYNSQDAFNNPKLTLHTADAFKWIASTKKKFNAVFVDFPEEYNMASIRTMSLQFMNDLKRILHQNGVFILQGDFTEEVNKEFLATVLNTARKVGMFPIMGFKEGSNKLDHFVIQIAVFKDALVRDEYLQRYQSYYLKHEHFSKSINDFSHLTYQDLSRYQSDEYVSFYDPSILKIIFQDYFKGKRL
jgi:spermidine synthase